MDFETTGLNHRIARPLSVGWVGIRKGGIVLSEAGYTRVRHRDAIPSEAIAIHRLVPEDVAEAPLVNVVGQRLSEALDGAILVAHGAHHERAMLRRCGIRWAKRDTIDTMRLAWSLDRLEGRAPERDYTLAKVARRHGLPVRRAHHAFGDALTAGAVLLALAVRLERLGRSRAIDLLKLGRP